MPRLTRLCHSILILHGLLNIAQGVYSLVSPSGYAVMTSDMFAGASEKALKSIGNCVVSFLLMSVADSIDQVLVRSVSAGMS
jgi:hypothetical protein